jgi:hypothetical protein
MKKALVILLFLPIISIAQEADTCWKAFSDVYNLSNNEKLELSSTCNITEYEFIIYNRWGNKMLESINENLPLRFDLANYNSSKKEVGFEAGVYVYILKYRKATSEEELKISGTLTFIK